MDNESGRKFNKDLAELEHLQNLEIEADKALIEGDNSRAYRSLRSMVAAFYSLLSESEQRSAKKILNRYSMTKSNKSVLDLRFFVGDVLVSKKLHLNQQVDMSTAADN